jgi:integrase/recombinase XerD
MRIDRLQPTTRGHRHGIHTAQEMSGNVSIKEVFRYTKPSQAEMEETAEGVYA